MALLYVDGSGQSRIDVLNGSDLIESITLPLCNQNGLTVQQEKQSLEHPVISSSLNNYNEEILYKVLGWRITFTLDYTQLIQKNDFLNIKRALDYEKQGYSIYLTPRIDINSKRYKVYFSGSNITYNIVMGGIYATGNKNVVLEYKTVGLQPYFDIQDPDNVYMDYEDAIF